MHCSTKKINELLRRLNTSALIIGTRAELGLGGAIEVQNDVSLQAAFLDKQKLKSFTKKRVLYYCCNIRNVRYPDFNQKMVIYVRWEDLKEYWSIPKKVLLKEYK